VVEWGVNELFKDHFSSHHHGTDYLRNCLLHDIPVCYIWVVRQGGQVIERTTCSALSN